MSNKNTVIKVSGVLINVKRKSMKTLRLKVDSDTVSISAPLRAPNYAIEAFAKNNLDWIKKNLRLAQEKQHEKESRLNSGENIKLWGRDLVLVFSSGATQVSKSWIVDNKLFLPLDNHAPFEDKLSALELFYRQELIRVIEQRLPIWEEVLKVKLTHWGVRKMKTRWGSCNIDRRRISLNLDLARWPEQCLDYVIVHELVHLYETHHTRRFWSLVASFMPSWKTFHNMLREPHPPVR